ncbi:MAG: putative reductase [Marmoricola sp.]|nr:putative reductase [Marmoricola sp.]
MTVGFVGAGSMGAPMVARLLAAGFEVNLVARRTEVADRFAALGAVVVASVAELAPSPVVIVCPFDETQLAEIVDGPDGLLARMSPGAVLVQHATVSAGCIGDLALRAAATGVVVVDAPISGRADDIAAGTLKVLYGGADDLLERLAPILGCYADAVIRTGDVGSATMTKLVNNLVFASHTQIAGAAVALGSDLGLEPGRLLEALTTCSANSTALATLRAVGDVDTFAALAVPYLRKDVTLIESEATALGISTGVLGRLVEDGPFSLVNEPRSAR